MFTVVSWHNKLSFDTKESTIKESSERGEFFFFKNVPPRFLPPAAVRWRHQASHSATIEGNQKRPLDLNIFHQMCVLTRPLIDWLHFMAGKLIDRLDSIGQRRVMGAHSTADWRIFSFNVKTLYFVQKSPTLLVIELCKWGPMIGNFSICSANEICINVQLLIWIFPFFF